MKYALVAALVSTVAASGKVNVPTKEIAPGVNMPIISIGTWTSDGHAGEEAPKIVGTWLGQGGRGIDTALIYMDQAKVAKAIADSGLSREDVFITTKIPGCGAAQFSIDRDLKDLNTSYIDLLLIHEHVGLSCSSTWKVLEDNVKNGKLKSIGISNFNAQNIEDILKGATIKPAVNQIQYNVFSHDEAVIAACRKHNITVEAYSPLAPPYSGKSVLKEPTVTSIAKAHNVSAFQVALKWIVQRGDVLTVLSSNPDHQASDADLWSFTLSESEMIKLGTIAQSHEVIVASPPAPDQGPLPAWPASFQSKFQSPSKQAKGTFAIGLDKSGAPAEVITLTDGTRDHLCSTYHNDTACTMLSTRGWKWLVWPELSRCCKCCSEANGCGPLAPTWLQNASGNIFYDGVASVTLGASTFQCRKWFVLGLMGWKHPNIYYEHLPTAGSKAGLPCEIDGYNYLRTPSQPANDQYIFEPESFSTRVAQGLFDLPDFCEERSYCGGDVCDAPPSETISI